MGGNGRTVSGKWQSCDWASSTTSATTALTYKITAPYCVTDVANTLSCDEWNFYAGRESSVRKIGAGEKTYELPDGAQLLVDKDGNYRIEDKAAKVTYKANRVREFSPYMNASDMLAQFVSYVGSLGVKRDEVLKLPLHLFVSWLIIEAAQRDGDQVPGDIIPVQNDPLMKAVLKPQCLTCGRFIPRLHQQHRFPYCGPEHGARHVERLTVA